MSDEMKDALPSTMGVLGQMFAGVGAGLGTGFANKMNERVTLAAAALTGILADSGYNDGPHDAAKVAQSYADALLTRLEQVPDPRFEDKLDFKPETVYHDAVQRLCEAAEIIADTPDHPERAQILRARAQAVLDAGKKLR